MAAPDPTGLVAELRRTVRDHRDWPTTASVGRVADAAGRLIDCIDQRAEMIEHMRAHVTPTQEAIAEIIGSD